MTERIPRRRLTVTYDTARETRIFVNDPTRQDERDLHVQFGCTMSVDPQRNRGTVTMINLSESTRNDLSGVIESTLDLRGSFQTPPPQRAFARFGSSAFSTGNPLADLYTPEQITRARLDENPVQKQTTIVMGGGYCEIDAGTDDEFGRIFEGSVSRVRSFKTGSEWKTRIEIADGLTNGLGAVANQTFQPGAQVFDVISHVVRSLGLDLGDLTLAKFQEAVGANYKSVLPRGYVASGNSNQVLSLMLTNTRTEWFIDRGTFYIVRKGQPIDPTQRPVLIEQGAQGGIRSTPVPIDEKGIFVDCDFRSDIRVGRLVQTVSEQLSGVWRCDRVDHQLDNRGQAWRTGALLRKIPTPGAEFLDG